MDCWIFRKFPCVGKEEFDQTLRIEVIVSISSGRRLRHPVAGPTVSGAICSSARMRRAITLTSSTAGGYAAGTTPGCLDAASP